MRNVDGVDCFHSAVDALLTTLSLWKTQNSVDASTQPSLCLAGAISSYRSCVLSLPVSNGTVGFLPHGG